MKENKFNPNNVVSRALLLIKYDSKKTLTENIEEQNYKGTQIGFNKNNLDPIDVTPKNEAPQNVFNINNTQNQSQKQKTTSTKKTKTPKTPKIDPSAVSQVVDPSALANANANANVNLNTNPTTPTVPPTGGAALSGLMTPGGWSTVGKFLISPVGVGAMVIIGTALYWAYRDADGKEMLERTIQVCKTGKKYGKEKEITRELSIKNNDLLQIAQDIAEGTEGDPMFGDWLGGLGTDEDKIKNAWKKLSRGNPADLCYMVWQYENFGRDLADDMAEDLSDKDFITVTASLRRIVSPFMGGGQKMIPEDSYNLTWYKEQYPCVFSVKDTFVKEHGVKIDPDGYTYIVIKGSPHKDTKGKMYNKLYRLYGEGDRLVRTFGQNNVKETNATFACDSGNKPSAVIQGSDGSEGESMYETFLRKNGLLKEVFDDTQVKTLDSPTAEDDLEGWEDGKKVTSWPVWLKKFPCLKQYHPNATPRVDNLGYTFFINLNPKNKKNYRFYSDGQIWTEDGMKDIGKTWACPGKGDSVLVEGRRRIMEQIPFDIEDETTSGNTSNTSGNTVNPTGNTVNPPKDDFKDCTDFPFVQGCYNRKIGEVQSCLNIKPIDAKFGPITLKALQNNGLGDSITKDVYDKLVDANGKCKSSSGSNSGTGSGTGSGNLPSSSTSSDTTNLSGGETN